MMKTKLCLMLLLCLMMSGCGNNTAQQQFQRQMTQDEINAKYNKEVECDCLLEVPQPKFLGLDRLGKLCGNLNMEQLASFRPNPFHDPLFLQLDPEIRHTPYVEAVTRKYNLCAFVRQLQDELETYLRFDGSGDLPVPEEPAKLRLKLSKAHCLAITPDESQHGKLQEIIRLMNRMDRSGADSARSSRILDLINALPQQWNGYLQPQEKEAYQANFWNWYDKSQYVSDIHLLSRSRTGDTSGLTYAQSDQVIARRMEKEKDFDTRCIYAIEMIQYKKYYDSMDFLAQLLEEGSYSKYLYEVWLNWRAAAQSKVFGNSSFSPIPNVFYDQSRQKIINLCLLHLQQYPDDYNTKGLIDDLITEPGIRRFGWLMGNDASLQEQDLKEKRFLPEEVIGL